MKYTPGTTLVAVLLPSPHGQLSVSLYLRYTTVTFPVLLYCYPLTLALSASPFLVFVCLRRFRCCDFVRPLSIAPPAAASII